MSSVFLGLPYTKPDTRDFTISMAQFMASKTKGIEYVRWKNAYGFDHAGSRNYLIDCWELEKTDYFLFIDNDCIFPMGAVERLVERDLPVVCGGMFTKTIPPRPTIGIYMGSDSEGKSHYSFEEYGIASIEYAHSHGVTQLAENAHLFPKTEHDLFECDACGMHFTLIRRDVLDALRKPYFLMLGKTGAGEDFYFCKKVRDVGFQIYADLSVQTGHSAGETFDFGLRELLHLNKIATSGVVFEQKTMRAG